MLSAETIIERLGLERLDQEGGYFRQTWCSPQTLSDLAPDSPCSSGGRHVGTAIYFLATSDQFSALHRLAGDEIWFHHLGDPLEMLMLHPDGHGETIPIGTDLILGQRPQHLCPAHVWQGTRIAPGLRQFGYALVSCTMAPGFDWKDFELGDGKTLATRYPEFSRTIHALTRP